MPPSIKDDASDDAKYMSRCLELAAAAAAAGEVPVGALVVQDGRILGEGRNRCEELTDPLAHGEMAALAAALAAVGEGRLPGATLYCNLEPCFMCTGALLHVRVARVVYGARDPKFGACGSLANLPADIRLNHRCPVTEGVLADQSAELLRQFFQRLRQG
ncbi:MAG: nucleoside deaminase [Planctomycetota bacterium]|jgi:tRNA(adenine34) deaminase